MPMQCTVFSGAYNRITHLAGIVSSTARYSVAAMLCSAFAPLPAHHDIIPDIYPAIISNTSPHLKIYLNLVQYNCFWVLQEILLHFKQSAHIIS